MRLVLASGLALAALTAVPASAQATLTCISLDVSCQSFSCPPDAVEVVNTGFTDTGPWIVICRPIV